MRREIESDSCILTAIRQKVLKERLDKIGWRGLMGAEAQVDCNLHGRQRSVSFDTRSVSNEGFLPQVILLFDDESGIFKPLFQISNTDLNRSFSFQAMLLRSSYSTIHLTQGSWPATASAFTKNPSTQLQLRLRIFRSSSLSRLMILCHMYSGI